MKMSLCQMIAIVCILVVGSIAVIPFVPTADAHPQEVHSYSLYDVEACVEDGTIVSQTLVWGFSQIVVPHDPNGSHQMNTRYFVSVRNVTLVTCSMG
ncbi:MAG: hypothetical protein OXI24_02835 [Candidatus Poribacteria bacterium]|nr:hypothetical protein [Candidatus Poribacteria bacterium]